jgi:hypothetical protein
MMLGLSLGIRESSKSLRKDILGAIGTNVSQPSIRMMNAPMSAPPVYGGTTVTFGDVNLSGNMDFAVFKAMFDKYIGG